MLRMHSASVAPFSGYERRIFKTLADNPSQLDEQATEVLRYAFALTRMEHFPADHGSVDLFDLISPYRHWFLGELTRIFGDVSRNFVDWRALQKLIPNLRAQVDAARSHLLDHNINRFSEDQFEQDLCNRKVVIVLGGGGGAGYAHMGVFPLLSGLGINPSLIVGSSMGALLGLFRAASLDDQAMAVAQELPAGTEFNRVFGAYSFNSQFCVPGAVELKIRGIGTHIFNKMLRRDVPRMNELPIPMRIVSTGLRTGIDLAVSDVEADIKRNNRMPRRAQTVRRLATGMRILSQLVANPRMLEEVVFGRDEGLEDFDALDAVGFSCAVPGVLHYDIFRKGSLSEIRLKELFNRRRIARLTDGGVVSNVASRVAWQSVHAGEIGSPNALILAFDAFAPVAGPDLNTLFLFAQRAVHGNVVEQRPYCDYLVSYRSTPSPARLLLTQERMIEAASRSYRQMKPLRKYLKLATRPVPRWQMISPSISP